MPRRELKYPIQVEDWLVELGKSLSNKGNMILIGSGALFVARGAARHHGEPT